MSWAMSLRFSSLFILSYVSVLSTDQPRNCVKDLIRGREGNNETAITFVPQKHSYMTLYDIFWEKHNLDFGQNSSNEQPHLCSKLWLAPQQSSFPAVESAQALRASMLWRLKDLRSSSEYKKLFLCCCMCLQACGKVSVTIVTAGQDLSHQKRAGWSHHLSQVFIHILCLLSIFLLSSGQIKLIFFPLSFCLVRKVCFRKYPDW